MTITEIEALPMVKPTLCLQGKLPEPPFNVNFRGRSGMFSGVWCARHFVGHHIVWMVDDENFEVITVLAIKLPIEFISIQRFEKPNFKI